MMLIIVNQYRQCVTEFPDTVQVVLGLPDKQFNVKGLGYISDLVLSKLIGVQRMVSKYTPVAQSGYTKM